MINYTFKNLYSRLNKAQKEAVDTIEGPVMVIAGPGTGKTTILTLRIANILENTDTPPSGILAITYTDAGVKAMRGKLQSVIGDRAYDVKIHTFHGFASAIIAEYPDHFIHISDMKQMTDIEQESIIRSIISKEKYSVLRPSGRPDAYLFGILKSIDDAKREAYTPAIIKVHAKTEIEKIKNDEDSLSTRGASKGQLKAEAKELVEKCEKTELFADIYEEYEEEKRKQKKMDFNDLIIELLLVLKGDELLLRLIQEKYLYIHVDEHQDTNDAQNFIISIIAEFFETPNVFIVGDEKQAIYRFQGASVENFMLLQKRWSDMKLISLDTNYRSHQGILDASFAMIEKNYEEDENKDLRIKLESGSDEKIKQIDIVVGENMGAMEAHLIKEIKTLTEKEPKASIAIIVKRNRDIDRIISLFEHNNIPVSSERSIDIFNHPVGRLFFDFIEYVSDVSKVDMLSKTIIAGMWNVSFEKGIEMIKSLKGGVKYNVENVLPQLHDIRSRLLNDSPINFLIESAELSDFTKIISRDPNYVDVWRGIVALAESLTRESDIHEPAKLIESLLAYRLSAETRIVKVSVGAPDLPLQAMTAHGSKGLEFDYVFIPYATEEAWVGRAKGSSFILPKKSSSDGDVRDIRRLFYVALTRARRHAIIFTALGEADGKILTPLRFIDELDTKHITYTHLPRLNSHELYDSANSKEKTDVNRQKNQPLIDLAKRTLLSKGLSVTALNHFIKCPNTFLYQSMLKLPQAPSASAEKGTAMHSAIDALWKLENKTLKNIETTLTEKIAEFFAISFLNSAEKEIAKKELFVDAPIVAKALESHFNSYKDSAVFSESWVKTEFKVNYSGESFTIPLHGKMDAIVDSADSVYVFDYKTKQAMSVNAIKGETKSSDGGYFRQLVFYKMLISSDSRWRNKRISPSLVFVSPDDKGRCPTVTLPIELADIEKVNKEIQTLVEAVWSGEIVNKKCEDAKCEWCGMAGI